MNIALWIVAGLLALAMLASGATKIVNSREKLIKATPYVEDYPTGFIRFVGVSEVLAALGLILPGLTGIAPILVPIAASALFIIMVGAVVIHLRRGDGIKGSVPAIVLGLVALFVAISRFGAWPL